MRRRWPGWVVAAAAALAAGCASMRVGSHVERQLDFARYRTYDWGSADALPADDPRLARNPYFRDALEGAVERQMAARGFARGPSAEAPDLRLHYHASIDSRLTVHEGSGGTRPCASGGCAADVEQFEAGTIVIDVIDQRSGLLIWRGWVQGRIEDVLRRPEELAARVTAAVERLFAQLPATGVARVER
jgi:hypothetical protein